VKKIVRLGIGAAVFAAGMFLPMPIKLIVLIAAYLIIGGEVVLHALRNIIKGKVFDENFLMTLASAGAFAIGDYPEAVAVMLFYQVGETFQEMAVDKSERSIIALMDIRPDYANLLKGETATKTSPESVNIGDLIIVKPGERIPLDGVIADGESSLDTSALTGEAYPRKVAVGDEVLSGCVNKGGLLTVRVTSAFGESAVSRILALVQEAGERKAPTENFITKFARYYTPAVVITALLIAAVPTLIFGNFTQWLNRGLIFLVISCPCALVVSIPLGFFGGIGGAAKRGILVKGGNFLEALSKVDAAAFDKTGTLTRGVFKVVNAVPESGTADDLIKAAAHAEYYSNHPIAKSVLAAYEGEISAAEVTNYAETAGRGVSATAPFGKVAAGNREFITERTGQAIQAASEIGTVVYVAVEGVYAGRVIIADEIKPDAKDAVAALKNRGVSTVAMLTGDNSETADSVGKSLGVDIIHAGLLPEQKVEVLEELIKTAKGKVAFVGDGINDAPVLARADIGVAMGALGSDAAMEAADVVLMNDSPSKLAEAIDIARFTKRVVWQNIVFALGVKAAFLLLGAFGIATMWGAVFADVGVALLAILNAARVAARGKK